MVPEFGWPFFWSGAGNLLVVLVLQWLIAAPRPVDVSADIRRVREPASAEDDVRGFPCVDCHMAVVVLLPTLLHARALAVQVAIAALLLFIAATRLLLGSRFASQVVGSWLTGLVGVLAGNHGHAVVKAHRLSRGYKYVLGRGSLTVENQDADNSWVVQHSGRGGAVGAGAARARLVGREQPEQTHGCAQERLYAGADQYPLVRTAAGQDDRVCSEEPGSSGSAARRRGRRRQRDRRSGRRGRQAAGGEARLVLFPDPIDARAGQSGAAQLTCRRCRTQRRRARRGSRRAWSWTHAGAPPPCRSTR